MRVLLCFAFLLVALGKTRAADDADTLTIEGVRFRLDGIDAPELDQPCLDSAGEVYFCGRKAHEELQKFIANRVLRCDDGGVIIEKRPARVAMDRNRILLIGGAMVVALFLAYVFAPGILPR